jgi:hypothetical protein
MMPETREAMLDDLDVRGKAFVEIGTFVGDFASEILKREPAELTLIDPWVEQPMSVWPNDHSNASQPKFDDMHAMVVDKFKGRANVRILREYSLRAARLFPDESLDFAYVDAIHTFESCLVDVVTWWHKVRPGGWLLGHDYTGKYQGVAKAVNMFCQVSGEKVSLLTQESAWASWGIRKT